MKTQWMDLETYYGQHEYNEGDLVFIIEVTERGNSTFVGQADPGHKNMSGEPVLDGWLGSTNNVNKTAYGMGEILHISTNCRLYLGDRAQVRPLADTDQRVIDICKKRGVTI